MAHLEGSLPAAVAADLKAHLGACGACRAELAAMKEISEAVEAMGVENAARLPQIDLTQAVLQGAAALRTGHRQLKDLLDEREDLIAYLDDELDDFSAARIDRERAKDALLDAELDALATLGEDLQALGVATAAEYPRVDLVESVVARAKARAIEQDALPPVFHTLPEGVRLAAERFIEGEATAEQAAELRDFAASSPALTAALDEYTALHDGLEAIAAESVRGVPRIDISAEVMSAVRKMRRHENVTPMRHRDVSTSHGPQRAPRRTAWWLSAAVAAAACVMFGLYLGRTLPVQAPGDAEDKLAKAEPQKIESVPANDVDLDTTLRHLNGEGEPLTALEGESMVEPDTEPQAPEEPMVVALAGNAARTLKDVLDARQKAFENDADALARLVRWSSLSEEEARKIASDKNADPQAVIGAAEFLPAGEAAALLKAAAERNPDDPYLQKALAKAYAANGDTELARQALDAWGKLDPENSMPRYMAARLAFQEGDSAGGMLYLSEAARYDHGSMYSSEAARYRQGALNANGYNGDVANFLAGSTAGTADYNYISAMANDLIDQGNQLRDQGKYQEAEDLYLGVYNLGAQISNSAQLVNDFDTAYSVQGAALQALITLSQLFAGVDTVTVNQLLAELNSGLAALADLMSVYSNIFGSANIEQILMLIGSTLNGGQLDFLQR